MNGSARGLLRAYVAAALIVAGCAAAGAISPSLPHCEEDQAIVGVGSFDNGRWSDYQCGPALDDYQSGAHAGAIVGEAIADLFVRIER